MGALIGTINNIPLHRLILSFQLFLLANRCVVGFVFVVHLLFYQALLGC